MKVIAIHQPQYLPWLGLLDRIARVDEFVILDNVPYSKNYFYNRNRIKTANGPIWITVPVLTKGKDEPTFVETHINKIVDWRAKHRKSITFSYCKAPFFDQYSRNIYELLDQDWEFLADVAIESTRFLMEVFGIHTPLVRASELGVQGNKEDLLISICQKLEAKAYLSGPDGANYLTLEKWQRLGFKVDFQNYVHPQYQQLHGSFASNMSAIDLLFNVGGNHGREILSAGQQSYFTHQTKGV